MAIKSKKGKLSAREKVKIRIRKKVTGGESRPRLSVYRSAKHLYAQLIVDSTGETLASASTLDPEVLKEVQNLPAEVGHNDAKSTKSVRAAHAVGLVLARRSLEKKVQAAVFDRNGFVYTGRIQAVAEGARKGGLQF